MANIVAGAVDADMEARAIATKRNGLPRVIRHVAAIFYAVYSAS